MSEMLTEFSASAIEILTKFSASAIEILTEYSTPAILSTYRDIDCLHNILSITLFEDFKYYTDTDSIITNILHKSKFPLTIR